MTLHTLYDISETKMRNAIMEYTNEIKESKIINDPVFVKYCKKLIELRNQFFFSETEENKAWLVNHGYITPPENIKHIIIDNIPLEVNNEMLESLMNTFGKTQYIRMQLSENRESKSATVYFYDQNLLDTVRNQLNNTILNGNTISVIIAPFRQKAIRYFLITGLHPNTIAEDLYSIFCEDFNIQSIKIPTINGEPANYAYVALIHSSNTGVNKIKKLAGSYINGNKITIQKHKAF